MYLCSVQYKIEYFQWIFHIDNNLTEKFRIPFHCIQYRVYHIYHICIHGYLHTKNLLFWWKFEKNGFVCTEGSSNTSLECGIQKFVNMFLKTYFWKFHNCWHSEWTEKFFNKYFLKIFHTVFPCSESLLPAKFAFSVNHQHNISHTWKKISAKYCSCFSEKRMPIFKIFQYWEHS